MGWQRNNGIDDFGLVWKNPETDTYGCLSYNPSTDFQMDRACRGQNRMYRLGFKKNWQLLYWKNTESQVFVSLTEWGDTLWLNVTCIAQSNSAFEIKCLNGMEPTSTFILMVAIANDWFSQQNASRKMKLGNPLTSKGLWSKE